MRRLSWVLCCFVFCLSTVFMACAEKTSRKKANDSTPPPYSPVDYKALSDFNEVLADGEVAWGQAIGRGDPATPSHTADEGSSPGIGPLISEKAAHLAEILGKAISDNHCVKKQNQEPSSDYSRFWRATKHMEGAGCPVKIRRTWEFRRNALSMTYRYKAVDEAYRKESGLDELAGNGTISVTLGAPGTSKVTGEIHFPTIAGPAFGKVVAEISTVQNYSGLNGTGYVEVIVSPASGRSYKGRIDWKGEDFGDRTYKVDGKRIEQKDFQRLFSFFNLDKLVDDSERMR